MLLSLSSCHCTQAHHLQRVHSTIVTMSLLFNRFLFIVLFITPLCTYTINLLKYCYQVIFFNYYYYLPCHHTRAHKKSHLKPDRRSWSIRQWCVKSVYSHTVWLLTIVGKKIQKCIMQRNNNSWLTLSSCPCTQMHRSKPGKCSWQIRQWCAKRVRNHVVWLSLIIKKKSEYVNKKDNLLSTDVIMLSCVHRRINRN